MTGLHQSDPPLNTKKACYNLFFWFYWCCANFTNSLLLMPLFWGCSVCCLAGATLECWMYKYTPRYNTIYEMECYLSRSVQKQYLNASGKYLKR